MTAIRAVFDGKVFVPKQPVSLPTQCEALVLVDAVDQAEQRALDHAVRAYYQYSPDSEDEAWERAILQALPRAWDED